MAMILPHRYLLVQTLLLTASIVLPIQTLAFSNIHHSKSKYNPQSTVINKSMMSSAFSSSESWKPTRSKEFLDPKNLSGGCPQMAKDTDFANAVINAWNEEVTESKPSVSSETRQITYQDGDSSTSLYGHLVRRQSSVESNSDPPKSVPGVLLFHTGAGPHDVSLLWKADSLVCNEELFPDGCVVLITDIISDDVGWSWSPDRSQFNAARKQVLETLDEKGERPVLKSRIRAALTALQTAAPEIDMDRLASLGWCLGGHSLFEMGRMNIPGMKAMITFHGVFGSVPSPNNTAEDKSQTMHESNKATILICNGDLDPFVNQETDLTNAIDTFRANGHTVRLVNLEGAKHGFSNPAQDFNPNEAFAYNDEAARQSWSETLNLLKETF